MCNNMEQDFSTCSRRWYIEKGWSRSDSSQSLPGMGVHMVNRLYLAKARVNKMVILPLTCLRNQTYCCYIVKHILILNSIIFLLLFLTPSQYKKDIAY